LSLLPARPGPNRFVVTLGPETPSGMTAVELLLQRLDVDQGSTRIDLREVGTESAGRSTWQADGGLLAPDSSWTASVILQDAAATELARQRFDLAMDGSALADGRASQPLDVITLVALLLTGLALLAAVFALAGGSIPRTEPGTMRRGLLTGALVAGSLGLLMIVAWPPR